MSVFGAYSRYYDLLYKDKDYRGEAEYVHRLIQRHCPQSKSLLNLGCGTGRHDLLLAEKGYHVTGVDLSGEMLAIAKAQVARLPDPPLDLDFRLGDLRTIRFDKSYDAVVSLFHVMSYQSSNDDLSAAIATARAHLKPEGIFIFDCWYGPAVLTDPPAVRVKRLEDQQVSVTRIAEPLLYPNENLVDVQYQIFVRNKETEEMEELRETHRMRYLFRPELELLLKKHQMHILASEEWMSGKEPGSDTWGVCFVVGR